MYGRPVRTCQTTPVKACRVKADHHLVVPRNRLVDVPEVQDLRGAVSVLGDGLHRGLPASGAIVAPLRCPPALDVVLRLLGGCLGVVWADEIEAGCRRICLHLLDRLASGDH